MAAAPGPAQGSDSPTTLFPLSSGRQGLVLGNNRLPRGGGVGGR